MKEAGVRERGADGWDIVVPVGDPPQEARRIVGKERRDDAGRQRGECILLDTIPDTEDEPPAGFEDPMRLYIGLHLVRKERDAELADYGVKLGGPERQHLGVSLPPLDVGHARTRRDRK